MSTYSLEKCHCCGRKHRYIIPQAKHHQSLRGFSCRMFCPTIGQGQCNLEVQQQTDDGYHNAAYFWLWRTTVGVYL